MKAQNQQVKPKNQLVSFLPPLCLYFHVYYILSHTQTCPFFRKLFIRLGFCLFRQPIFILSAAHAAPAWFALTLKVHLGSSGQVVGNVGRSLRKQTPLSSAGHTSLLSMTNLPIGTHLCECQRQNTPPNPRPVFQEKILQGFFNSISGFSW